MSSAPPRGVVGLLTAEALAFGVTLALLIIPANALFLDTYGSEWLPATYIAIAVFGTAISALIARAARRATLVRVATASLGGFAALFAASWFVLQAGGIWVSAVLLVLFPIALQVGFVLIGGQAGRLLDVRQMKEHFPRIVSGFAVGFFVGGLLGIPLLALLGSTAHMLVATTLAQVAFLALLIVTERRFPEAGSAPPGDAPVVARPPLRTVFASGLVLLLLVYQVLSAMGSQVVDFLLFDRASAHYSGDDLTRFLAGYTAVLNLVDIVFLAVVAGPLMRRFGLRFGLVFNPALVAAILAVMAVVVAGTGAAAFSVLVLAGVLRIADIAATDGTTRTSINAAYQVVPIGERLAVQAVVEGIGVPVAMGATGVMLLALNLLDLGTDAVIVFGLVLGLLWAGIAIAVYRSYTRSLADEMRRRVLGTTDLVTDADGHAIRALLVSEDARDVRLGLDLLSPVVADTAAIELRQLSAHADPEVRVRALGQLAAAGDDSASLELAGVLPALLDDRDATVRNAALDAVGADNARDPAVVRSVIAAIGTPRTTGSATAALRRLGEPAVPALVEALGAGGRDRRSSLVRAAASEATTHGAAIIEPLVRDPDRSVVLAALEAVEASGGRDVLAGGVLDGVLRDASALASRAQAARATLSADDDSLRRALDDEVELARRLAIAALALQHGQALRSAVRVVDHADRQRSALGIEWLDVILSRDEGAIALPLIRREAAKGTGDAVSRGREEWIADLANDPVGFWRSSWLATCARHAIERAPRPPA